MEQLNVINFKYTMLHITKMFNKIQLEENIMF